MTSAPSLFEALSIPINILNRYKKQPFRTAHWRRVRVFPALPRLSPRFARCHVGENSPPGCFLPQTTSAPSLFESLQFAVKLQSKTKKQPFRTARWRRVRDSNPRYFPTQHFECCTFDHSDNSPSMKTITAFREKCKKFMQEIRKTKLFEPPEILVKSRIPQGRNGTARD